MDGRHSNKVAVSVTYQSYFPGDGCGFVKGLYPRKAKTTDHLSNKQSKQDLRVKQVWMG